MIEISAVITCFNNQDTILKCVKSVEFADEIVILDSFSTDETLKQLEQTKSVIHQQKFKGFSKQKQDAINLAKYDWVLLLDSDEFLTMQAQKRINEWKQNPPTADAYELPRREWVFWQWSHNWVRCNHFIRLFNRNKAQVSNDLVHESIKCNGSLRKIKAEIKHLGETSIAKKIEKINFYSQLAAEQKYKMGKRVSPIKLLFYPAIYFIKQYFFRRQIFNGWAGLINASLNSRYAFLKYAKLYELQKNKN